MVEWQHGGPTEIGNLVMLCGRDHRVLHESHWVVRFGDGLPEFVPPRWIDPEQRVPRRPASPTSLRAAVGRRHDPPTPDRRAAGRCRGRPCRPVRLGMIPRCSRTGDVGDGTADAGLVFVSYSHADAVWAQRFRVFLKPLVRRKRLTLWDDTEIRATEEWHPAIQAAIARSRWALLLVSADFLASDYVMDRELPALLRHGVGLAPALIADCFWQEVPELAAVQFLLDAGRDGALSRHAEPGCSRPMDPSGLRPAARCRTRARTGHGPAPRCRRRATGPATRGAHRHRGQ